MIGEMQFGHLEEETKSSQPRNPSSGIGDTTRLKRSYNFIWPERFHHPKKDDAARVCTYTRVLPGVGCEKGLYEWHRTLFNPTDERPL